MSRHFRSSKLTAFILLAAGSLVTYVSSCGAAVLGGVDVRGSATASSTATSSVTLSQISCGTLSLTGAQAKACSVYLTAAVKTSTAVTLNSNNANLTVPATVTVPAGAKTGGFKIVASSVTRSVNITITGSEGGATKTDVITLYPAQTPTSSITVSRVSCGTTTLTGPTTKGCSVYLSGWTSSAITVTLSSNNAALQVQGSVTVPAGSSSAGFGVTALAVTATQSATLTAKQGDASQTDVLQLMGSGTQGSTQHHVTLTWSPPSSTNPAVVGYNVYRAVAGSSYVRLTSSDPGTSYTDSRVVSGETYDYEVKSVDSAGLESSPSNQTSVTIP